MPIPNDPLHRQWVEISSVNPQFVEVLRPALLAFMAYDHGRVPRFAGTGFFIAATPEYGLAITAKHVLSEGVATIQRPEPMYAASSLFVPDRLRHPSLNPEKLKVVWMGSDHANMLNSPHANYNETLDIACCVITPEEVHAPFQSIAAPIDTRVPKPGDVVHMVSLDNMIASEIEEPADPSGKGQIIFIHRRVSIRIGCRFRRKAATCSDLKAATVPI
jgi:hypothetical protein